MVHDALCELDRYLLAGKFHIDLLALMLNPLKKRKKLPSEIQRNQQNRDWPGAGIHNGNYNDKLSGTPEGTAAKRQRVWLNVWLCSA